MKSTLNDICHVGYRLIFIVACTLGDNDKLKFGVTAQILQGFLLSLDDILH